MTYITETGPTIASRRRPLVRSDVAPAMAMPSEWRAAAASRKFVLRNDASVLGGKQIGSRAFPKGEDS